MCIGKLITIKQVILSNRLNGNGVHYQFKRALIFFRWNCSCDAYQSHKHILLEKEVQDFEHVDGGTIDQGQMNWELWGDFSSTPGP